MHYSFSKKFLPSFIPNSYKSFLIFFINRLLGTENVITLQFFPKFSIDFTLFALDTVKKKFFT